MSESNSKKRERRHFSGQQKETIVDNRRLRLLQLAADFREDDWCCSAHYGYVIESEVQLQFQHGHEL